LSAGRVAVSSKKNWGTPKKYVDAVKCFFEDSISLDPCSNEHSIVNAETEYILPENDGLTKSWNYPSIYVNPPYGIDKERKTTIKNWLEKCYSANIKYNSEVIALVPVATNTRHWKDYVFGKADSICFLYDTRLRFLENGKDTGNGAPMSCSIIYWGRHKEKFYDIFIGYGAVVDISNLKDKDIIGIDRNNILSNIFK